MSSNLLKIDNLRTSFFTQDGEVKAVDGISFKIDWGETVGVVGESGCGKSVTALSIMRLVPSPPGRIIGGEINYGGKNLLRLNKKEMRRIRGSEITMIPQDPMTSLNPTFSVGFQISEGLKLHLNMNSKEARERSIELLRMVGIPSPEHRVKNYPHQFSGGMRQRVMIAMSLSCSPNLLLADEPTTALDVTIQVQIIKLVQNLSRELRTAVMWITHDLGVVAGLCDRIIVMYAGRIVESAPVDDLYARPGHPYTVGLLNSLPRLDKERKAKLVPIKGFPPDLINIPLGCAFEPRCDFAKDVCRENSPELRSVGPGHLAACWVDRNEMKALRP